MGWHHDKERKIFTGYHFFIEGVELNFKDSCCPGATISLYGWGYLAGERELLYTTIDFPRVLHWTPPASQFLSSQVSVEIEYLEDGDTHREMLVTEKEADEIASRAAYDGLDVAHIAVTRTLSVGTGTICFKVLRYQWYLGLEYKISLAVEFGNSEDGTRFLDKDMGILEDRFVHDRSTGVAVIDDIMCALSPIADDLSSAQKNALRRGLPYSQFQDEYPQPKTRLIRHRASDRAYDRPCYLTLHITVTLFSISNVDWSATTIPPTFPLRSDTFRSLNSLHLKFPSPTSQDRNPNSSSQSHQDDLTITISAREISFTTGTDSVSLGNGFTLSSEHRTVTVNYINAIMGDAFLGTINGGNNGGRKNVNNSFSMRTDEGVNMLNDLRSINDLANGSLANTPLTTGSTNLRSGQSMIGTKPARKTISTYARRFATAIRFRPPRTTERHDG